MDAAGHKRRSEGLHDAIVAVSTAAGRAAIGVVRLTGPGSLELLVVLTRRTLGVRRHPVVRTIVDPVTSEPIDRAVVWFAEAPATYTGEDLVEIHAHGNPLILEAIVEACCHLGARRATPGEFTRRALDHGKLDLAGAEAILAAVEATSRGGALLAARALTGFLGQRVTHLRGEILAIAAIIEAAVDFEDDIDDIEVDRLRSRLVGLQEGFEQMAARVAENGRLLSGADVALLGPVNAGKSTLFNQLMGEDRSIVHETPGTTRDVVSAEREIDGLRIRFHDTAGLRRGAGEVENEGIRRARSLRDRVDLVVYVRDATRPRDGEPQASDLVVFNKADLGGETSGGLAISALRGDGVDELMVRIREILAASEPGDAVLWTGRQGAAAAAAARHLDRAREQLGIGEFGPAAAEITEALVAVQDILGVDPQRDVLDELFTRFCVGK